MNSTYQLLFRINFYHSYFTNGNFTNFQLKPDQLTDNIFKNYDLILRREVNGIAIFFAEHFADNIRTREEILSDNLVLNFKITLNDANFFNYTDYMPSVIEENLFYFKNCTHKNIGNYIRKIIDRSENFFLLPKIK